MSLVIASFAAICPACAAPQEGQVAPIEPLRAERLDALRAEWTAAAVEKPSLGWIALVQRRGRTELHESDWNESFWTTQRLIEIDDVEILPYRPDTIFYLGSPSTIPCRSTPPCSASAATRTSG